MRNRIALRALIATFSLASLACREDSAPTAVRLASPSRNESAGPLVESSLALSDTSLTDKYIVVLRDDVADPATYARNVASTHRGALTFIYRSVIRGFAGTFAPAAIQAIAKLPDVLYVEPVVRVSVAGAGSSTAQYWNLDFLDQASLTRDFVYAWDQDGTGVTTYLIDSGVNGSLSEFGGRAQTVADYSNQGGGWGVDCADHGTAVASLLGGATYGVAKNVQLRSVRIAGCDGAGDSSAEISAMDWVAANGVLPAVVNISIAGNLSSAVNSAVQRLENAGYRVVVAAGNFNDNAANHSPSSANTTFTVGNVEYTGSALQRASDSDYGYVVNMWAIGTGSAKLGVNGSPNSRAGTSMASPQVAGWVAVFLSANPGISKATLQLYAHTVTKMFVPNLPGAPGVWNNFLYTRLQFVSFINPQNAANVPAGNQFTFTTTQLSGQAPYTFAWKSNGSPVCANTSSCTLNAPGVLNTDIIQVTTTDALGRVWTEQAWLNGTCDDGGYSC
jgi:hypothetical protein